MLSSLQNSTFYTPDDNQTTMETSENDGKNLSSSQFDITWKIFDTQYLRHSLEWTITLIVAYTLIFLIGVIGNSMVILVVYKKRQMRTVTNLFIANLAVADLFVIVFCVPATLVSNVFTPWILGSCMCKAVAYVQGVSVCASAYSLAAIALDRCKAIYSPLERSLGLSKSQALVIIFVIWMISALLISPWLVVFSVISSDEDGFAYCVESWETDIEEKVYFIVGNLICCYCLPLLIITISNVIILCHVSNRSVPHDSVSVNPIEAMHRETRRGVRNMLGIVTLTFLLSWLPLYVVVTFIKFSRSFSPNESYWLDILMPIFQWLGSMSSSINPVLYAFLNAKFRKMFKSLLPSWMCLPKERVMSATITNGSNTVGTEGKLSRSSHGFSFSYRTRRTVTQN